MLRPLSLLIIFLEMLPGLCLGGVCENARKAVGEIQVPFPEGTAYEIGWGYGPNLQVEGKLCSLMGFLKYEDNLPPVITKLHETLTGDLIAEIYDQVNSAPGGGTSPLRLHDFQSMVVKVVDAKGSVVFRNHINGFSENIPSSPAVDFPRFPEEISIAEGKVEMVGDAHERKLWIKNQQEVRNSALTSSG